LAPGAPDSARITLVLPGSSLVGTTLSYDLAREAVERIAIDGFFPPVTLNEAPPRRGAGLMTFGLPYERDPAITRHVASFVARHLNSGARVDALLVNGGVFHAPGILARLAQVVEGFSGQPLLLLKHTDPDLAVARGACVFGQALGGQG